MEKTKVPTTRTTEYGELAVIFHYDSTVSQPQSPYCFVEEVLADNNGNHYLYHDDYDKTLFRPIRKDLIMGITDEDKRVFIEDWSRLSQG